MEEENKDKKIEKEKISLFAETSISENQQNYTAKVSKYPSEKILEMLEDPYKNASKLQEVSLWMYYNNGIYNRIINNYAGQNIYDLYLYPTIMTSFIKDSKKKTASEKMLKGYVDVANIFEIYSYKSNWRNIGVNLLLQGEVFLYRVSDNTGSLEREIPTEFCKIAKVINDGLYKYAINMKKLNEEKVRLMMPLSLQQLWEKHSNDIIPQEQYMDASKNWLIVDDPNAICLSLNNNVSTRSIPPLSYIMPSITRLMDEEIQEIEDNKINNLKLIHMQYELDDEGEPKIDNEELIKMHRQAKANLPHGVAINTNPLKVTTHTLQRSGNVQASSRQALTELVYNNAGVNSEIFNGNKGNNQAIISGLQADKAYVNMLNNIFENYAKYIVKSEIKKPMFLPRLIRNTVYDEAQIFENCMSSTSVGLSRLKLLGAQHYSPLEGISVLDFEVSNGLDKFFVPLSTSYTQSGNTSAESQGGREKAKNDTGLKGVGDNKDSTNE